ncbi:hypothetical protein [Streptomyces sp. NBC_01571]|uniref:hypothetical protein n=1 Tax=Streptomyces sp. NBC_01571 TaxID=2975883 RepID=UPI00224F91C6|nr:hypothetical protein [Streptomyces sp. NBC_01571]
MTGRQRTLFVRESAPPLITLIQPAVRLFPLGSLFGKMARSGTPGRTRGVAHFRRSTR